MAVNRRLRGCKCQSDDSEIALKTPSVSRQALTGVQMSGSEINRRSYKRGNRRIRGCKCQSDDSEIALKTPPHGSQSAVKWQSIGAYGGANVSQMTAKSSSKRQTAVSRQANGIQSAHVSQTAAKSHSSRRMIFPPLLWGDQGASQNHRPPKRGNFIPPNALGGPRGVRIAPYLCLTPPTAAASPATHRAPAAFSNTHPPPATAPNPPSPAPNKSAPVSRRWRDGSYNSARSASHLSPAT